MSGNRVCGILGLAVLLLPVWMLLLGFGGLLRPLDGAVPCNVRQFAAGLVCVCNETYCDTLDGPLTPVDRNHLIVVSSSKVSG